jgi:hypothetical protein
MKRIVMSDRKRLSQGHNQAMFIDNENTRTVPSGP